MMEMREFQRQILRQILLPVGLLAAFALVALTYWLLPKTSTAPVPVPVQVEEVVAYNCRFNHPTEVLCFDDRGRMFKLDRRVRGNGPFVVIVGLRERGRN